MPKVTLKELMAGDMHLALDLMDTTRRTRAFYLAIHKIVMAEKKEQKEKGTRNVLHDNIIGFK